MRQAEVNSAHVATNPLSNISLIFMFTHIEQHYPKEKSVKLSKDLNNMIPQSEVKNKNRGDLLS